MRKVFFGVVIVFCVIVPSGVQAQDPFLEMVKEATKKVIRAVDLMVQRLQNKTIWLQNAQKVVENTLSQLKLDEIAQWLDKHREQYAVYYDELHRVKQIVADYREVRSIVNNQVLLVREYQAAIALFKNDSHFTPGEIDYMEKVYAGMLDRSVKNIDMLMALITSYSLRMTDGERRKEIRLVADHFNSILQDLRAFNMSNKMASLQRAKGISEIEHIKQYYGLQ